MSKQTYKAAPAKAKKQAKEQLKILPLLFLIAYGFVTVITPNLMALDSNGPKFLTLSLLNLVCFLYIFTNKEIKSKPEWYSVFFTNGIGIAYTGMIIISLLSFTKAINLLESILHFSKIFTTFSAAYLISVLITTDKRNILYLSIAMTLLLIFDCLTVFSGIHKYILGKIPSIIELKSVYSNKNILASSIFVKLPFALWLMVFRVKWMRVIGSLGIISSLLATFFMSTRAFYLGTLVLSLSLVIFFFIRYRQTHEKKQLQIGGIFLILLAFSFLTFTFIQRNLYPKNQDIYNKNIEARLATISTEDGRIAGWIRSWHVFKQEPLLGVGLGNWKIATLKEENQTSLDFTYQFKAHNDFIEIPTETGIFGGLCFIAIFFITAWIFIKSMFKNNKQEWITLLFLPVFGLLCYSFDAFFNFPQDRPEIQAIFALYIGIIIAISSLYTYNAAKASATYEQEKPSFFNRWRNFILIPSENNQKANAPVRFLSLLGVVVFGLLLLASSYELNVNFISLKLQRIVKEDLNQGQLSHPASMFMNGFPSLIDICTYGEPIEVHKARYLIQEKRFNEAIEILKKDKSSPYDARNEYFIAMAYYAQNNIDSGFVYSQKMYKLKPNFFKNISQLCESLKQKGRQKECEDLLNRYLNKNKGDKDAWLYTAFYHYNNGDLKKAAAVIDSASTYFPTDSLILNQKEFIDTRMVVLPYKSINDAAYAAYNAKNYKEAVQIFTELLAKIPDFADAHLHRAYSYYYMKEYQKSNIDLDFIISKGTTNPNVYNLRGANYMSLGKNDEACKNFKIAAEMNNPDGLDNYYKICNPIKK
ncbi:MAG: O-antigen ligase family protein [Bacteroidetes bacterium]|nr:O-antigen ligase family protein [Bacteroidota bacterium]